METMDSNDALKIRAELKNLTKVLAFIDGRLEDSVLPMKTQMQVDVAVEELFVNIVHYAYPGRKNGDAEISVRLETDPRAVVIRFVDSGIPYNPLEKADPDITLSADKRSIGGLGIFMVKKTMDDIRYERENDQNILTIRKRF